MKIEINVPDENKIILIRDVTVGKTYNIGSKRNRDKLISRLQILDTELNRVAGKKVRVIVQEI